MKFVLLSLICFAFAPPVYAYKLGDVLTAFGGIRYKITDNIASVSFNRDGYGKIYRVEVENGADAGSVYALKIIFSGNKDEALSARKKLNERLTGLLTDDISQAPHALLDYNAPLILNDTENPNTQILALPSKLELGDIQKFQDQLLLQIGNDAKPQEFSNEQRLRIVELLLEQTGEAFEELANHGLIHGDVKPGNIFPTAPLADILAGKGRFILGDYDKAPKLAESWRIYSPRYVAPELALNEQIPRLPIGDFYSLGMTVVEILFGREHDIVPMFGPGTEMRDFYEEVRRAANGASAMRDRVQKLFQNGIAHLNKTGQTKAVMQLFRIYRFVSASLEFNPRDRITALSELRGEFHATERLLRPWESDLAKDWQPCDRELVASLYFGKF